MKQEVVVQVSARSFVNVLKHVNPCVLYIVLKRVYKRCRYIFARYFQEFHVIVMLSNSSSGNEAKFWKAELFHFLLLHGLIRTYLLASQWNEEYSEYEVE